MLTPFQESLESQTNPLPFREVAYNVHSNSEFVSCLCLFIEVSFVKKPVSFMHKGLGVSLAPSTNCLSLHLTFPSPSVIPARFLTISGGQSLACAGRTLGSWGEFYGLQNLIHTFSRSSKTLKT